jgi:hypothetical protein
MNKCTIPECERKYYAKGYCEAHYKRFRAGKNMNIGFRTTERKAKIINNIALIPLGIDAKDGYMIVDKDFSYLDKYKCSLSKRGYPVAFIDGKITNLHSVIIGKPPKGLVTDHINRDKLDNRIKNLRLVSQKVNVRNAGMLNTNTSGHKGVCFNKRNKKWFAQSSFNGKHQFGGYYETKEEAILARQKLMDKYSNNS